MWSVANSLEHWGPKGWWLMRPNIASSVHSPSSSPPPARPTRFVFQSHWQKYQSHLPKHLGFLLLLEPPPVYYVSRQAATAQIEQNFFLAFSSTSFNTVRNLLKKRGEPPFTFRLVPTQMKMASATSFSSGRPFQKDTVVQVHPQKVKKPIFKREYHF